MGQVQRIGSPDSTPTQLIMFSWRLVAVFSCVPSVLAFPAPPIPDAGHARHFSGSSFGIPQNNSFDYVIVGGGNAGLTVAARLSAARYSVAVIEAGSFYAIDNGNLSQIPAFDAYFAGKDPNDFNPLIDWGF